MFGTLPCLKTKVTTLHFLTACPMNREEPQKFLSNDTDEACSGKLSV